MAEIQAKKGKDKILMFRLLKESSKKNAAKLALQIEHEWEYSRDAETTQTKDGSITVSKGVEVTLSISGLASSDDTNKMLKQSVIDGEMLEVWEIDLSEKDSSGKNKALYARGRLNSWSVPANVEDFEELETEMTIEGIPVEGYVTLSEEQQNAIQYTFADIVTGA